MPSSDSSKLQLVILPRQDVDDLWPLAEPLFAKSIPRSCGRLNLEELRQGAIEGRYGIALVGEPGVGVVAVGAMQILAFPDKRVLSVFAYSGDRRRAMHLWPIVEQHARELQCQEVQISGPRAWGRIFPDFSEAFTVYTKEV